MIELIVIFAAIFLGFQACFIINLIIFLKTSNGTIIINDEMQGCIIQFNSDEDFERALKSKYVVFTNRGYKNG